jgi:hypothetical protein
MEFNCKLVPKTVGKDGGSAFLKFKSEYLNKSSMTVTVPSVFHQSSLKTDTSAVCVLWCVFNSYIYIYIYIESDGAK